MNLYELKSDYMQFAEKLQDMDLDEQTIADTLDSMSGDLEAKATNTVMVARNMRATAEAIKQAEVGMAARRKAFENRADMLEKRVFSVMQETGISKIESPHFCLSIQNNPPSVEVFDSLMIPADYMKEVPATYTVDKALIKKAIGDGFEVLGARMVQGQRLAIK